MSLPEKRIVMESVSTLLPLYHSFGSSTQGSVYLKTEITMRLYRKGLPAGCTLTWSLKLNLIQGRMELTWLKLS